MKPLSVIKAPRDPKGKWLTCIVEFPFSINGQYIGVEVFQLDMGLSHSKVEPHVDLQLQPSKSAFSDQVTEPEWSLLKQTMVEAYLHEGGWWPLKSIILSEGTI